MHNGLAQFKWEGPREFHARDLEPSRGRGMSAGTFFQAALAPPALRRAILVRDEVGSKDRRAETSSGDA